MVTRRPTPQQIAARKLEIKRRYSHHQKVTRRGRLMAAIRLAELTRWQDDTFGAGVELAPGQQSEMLARIFVHHLIGLANGDRRASEWLQAYCPWISLRSREALISEASHCPIKYKARTLAWKLRLTDEQRARLRITTIAAIDVSDEQRAAIRKAKQAELQRLRRARLKADRVNSI